MSDDAYTLLNRKYVSKCEELEVIKRRLDHTTKSNNETIEKLTAVIKSFEKRSKKCSCKEEK